MKKIKYAFILSSFMMLVACGNNETSKTSNTAVLDVREIIEKSPVVAVINKKLIADVEPLQKALRDKQQALEKEVAKQGDPALSAKDLDALKTKIIADRKELLTEADELRRQSEIKQNEALMDVYGKLDKTIAAFNSSRNNQFTLILKKSYVLYTQEDLNITSNIERDFDKTYG